MATKKYLTLKKQQTFLTDLDDQRSEVSTQTENAKNFATFCALLFLCACYLSLHLVVCTLFVFLLSCNLHLVDVLAHHQVLPLLRNQKKIILQSSLDLEFDSALLSDVFSKFQPDCGRGIQYNLKKADVNFTVIDDSYNASYESISALSNYVINKKLKLAKKNQFQRNQMW